MAELKTHVVVKFHDEEYQVAGYRIMSKEGYTEWYNKVKVTNFPFYDVSFRIGEPLNFKNLKAYKAHITTKNITQTESKFLEETLGVEVGDFVDIVEIDKSESFSDSMKW